MRKRVAPLPPQPYERFAAFHCVKNGKEGAGMR